MPNATLEFVLAVLRCTTSQGPWLNMVRNSATLEKDSAVGEAARALVIMPGAAELSGCAGGTEKFGFGPNSRSLDCVGSPRAVNCVACDPASTHDPLAAEAVASPTVGSAAALDLAL